MMNMEVLKAMVSALIDSAEHTNALAWQTAASLSADTYDAVFTVFNIINDIRDGEIDDVDKAMELLMEASKEVEDDDD